jgi:hypothetical protein
VIEVVATAVVIEVVPTAVVIEVVPTAVVIEVVATADGGAGIDSSTHTLLVHSLLTHTGVTLE